MKALTIKQPWASLIVSGIKTVENRSRISHYRGSLAIHAGKSWDYEGEMFIKNHPQFLRYGLHELIKYSNQLRDGVIGTVKMVDCVTEHESSWFFGPYGYVFTEPTRMDFKPYIGQQSFFEIPEIIEFEGIKKLV